MLGIKKGVKRVQVHYWKNLKNIQNVDFEFPTLKKKSFLKKVKF